MYIIIIMQRLKSGSEFQAIWPTTENAYTQRAAQTAVGQGRLNQWAHWARAHGPRIFFFLRGPQLAVVKYIFKLIILLLPLMKPSSG